MKKSSRKNADETAHWYSTTWSKVRGELCSAVLAYAYSVAPPHCRSDTGEPDWTKFRSTKAVGRLLDACVGDDSQKALAAAAWSLHDEFEKRGGLLAIPNSFVTFDVPMRSASGLVYTVCIAALSMFPGPPHSADDMFGGDLNCMKGPPIPMLTSDVDAWSEWCHGFHTRLYEGWSVLCFFHLLDQARALTNYAALNAFPWMRETFDAFGPPHWMNAVSMRPRVKADNILDYMRDAPIPRSGGVSYPFLKDDVLTVLRRVGERDIYPTTGKLLVARDMMRHDVETRRDRLWRNKPQVQLFVTFATDTRDGVAVPYHLPDWYSYYEPALCFAPLPPSNGVVGERDSEDPLRYLLQKCVMKDATVC